MKRLQQFLRAVLSILLGLSASVPAFAATNTSSNFMHEESFYQEHIVSWFERTAPETYIYSSFDDGMNNDGPIDFTRLFTHHCYGVVGDVEQEECEGMFGPFADLQKMHRSGMLEEILFMHSPFSDMSIFESFNVNGDVMGETGEDLDEDEDEEDTDEDSNDDDENDDTTADLRGQIESRAQVIWQVCNEQSDDVQEQNYCFARNRGFLQRNSTIDIESNIR